jgi:hypothetical protein
MTQEQYSALQRQYGGQFVALRDDVVVVHADTYDALVDQIDAAGIDWTQLVLDFVKRADVIYIY